MHSHVDWLLTTGRFAVDRSALLSGLAKRLCADGLDLLRINVHTFTLHPEIAMTLHVWRPQEARSEARSTAVLVHEANTHQEFGIVQEIALGYARPGTNPVDNEAFRASPFYVIYQGAPRIRCRIGPDAATFDFPILRDLAAAGATDYVVWPLRLADGA